MSRTKRPTLRDVASKAGVSHMTVSRVVRGAKTVSGKTLRRVQMAIETLGYRPDPALSALAAYRSLEGGSAHGSVLAFLNCDGTDYTRTVFEGARREAGLLGYAIEQFRLSPEIAVQRHLSRTLFHRGMRGLIFGTSDISWKFDGWDWQHFAMVSLGALPHQPPMHAVAMDYFHSAFSGCAELRRAGCRRIGMVVDARLESRTGGRWSGGYAAWAFQNKMPAGRFDWKPNQLRQLKKWMLEKRIDGILTIHPELQTILPARGLRIGCLNSSGAPNDLPCYFLDPADIGREAVRLLHHALLRREFNLPLQPKQVALRGMWKWPEIQLPPLCDLQC